MRPKGLSYQRRVVNDLKGSYSDTYESFLSAEKKKPTGIAGGSSYAAQGPILPAARLRACGLFTCILLLATRKRVFKIQC